MTTRIACFSLLALLVLLVPHAALAAAPPSVADKVAVLEAAVASLQVTVNNLNSQLTTSNADIAALQAKLAYVSVETGKINGLVGPHVIFTRANVHIRSGSGTTDDGHTLTGLGNLIVGYNEEHPIVAVERSGSHNFIVGSFHSYVSTGGLVAGVKNKISGQWASVSGGGSNTASGNDASVSGGRSRPASGVDDWATGGLFQDF